MNVIIYHGIRKVKEFGLDPIVLFTRLGPTTLNIDLLDMSQKKHEYIHLYTYEIEDANHLIEGLLGQISNSST